MSTNEARCVFFIPIMLFMPPLNRYDYSFSSLGTICTLTITHENDVGLDLTIQKICAKVQYFEGIFSRFRSDSMLSVLNETKTADVNDDFLDLFRSAKHIYALTDGYFNPLTDIRTLGYMADFESTKHFSLQDIPEDLDMDAITVQ